MPQTIPATLIPGDGIGPEIMDAVLKVLAALGGHEYIRQHQHQAEAQNRNFQTHQGGVHQFDMADGELSATAVTLALAGTAMLTMSAMGFASLGAAVLACLFWLGRKRTPAGGDHAALSL